MGNRYAIEIDPEVVRTDLPRIDAKWRRVIRDTIREKLGSAPELYGKPLRRTLKGYWKLRVGDYRAVFVIEKECVRIILIAHRSVAYEAAGKRLR